MLSDKIYPARCKIGFNVVSFAKCLFKAVKYCLLHLLIDHITLLIKKRNVLSCEIIIIKEAWIFHTSLFL